MRGDKCICLMNTKEILVTEFSQLFGRCCLEYLFYFVQWIDKRYGNNYEQRKFSVDKIPKNPSMLSQGMKYAGAALGGVLVTVGAYLFAQDKKR